MARIRAAPGQPIEFVLRRERAGHRLSVHGRVGEGPGGRNAEGPGGDGLADDAAHLGDLVSVGGGVAGTALPHDVGAYRSVGHQTADV